MVNVNKTDVLSLTSHHSQNIESEQFLYLNSFVSVGGDTKLDIAHRQQR